MSGEDIHSAGAPVTCLSFPLGSKFDDRATASLTLLFPCPSTRAGLDPQGADGMPPKRRCVPAGEAREPPICAPGTQPPCCVDVRAGLLDRGHAGRAEHEAAREQGEAWRGACELRHSHRHVAPAPRRAQSSPGLPGQPRPTPTPEREPSAARRAARRTAGSREIKCCFNPCALE